MNEHVLTRVKVREYRQFGRSVLLTTMPFRVLQSIFTVQREWELHRKNMIHARLLTKLPRNICKHCTMV
jgi:DNA sulfur modification protein DndB